MIAVIIRNSQRVGGVGGTLSTSPLGPVDQSDHSVQLYQKGKGTSSTSHRPGQCNLHLYQGKLMEPWS